MSDAATTPSPSERRAAGGPVLQDEVTRALTTAFFEELAATGYGRLAMEAVARRAGAGKAALYRRWPSKPAMAVALVSEAATASEVPDTGSLHGDVREFLRGWVTALGNPLAIRVIPDLMAEAARNAELGEALLAAVRDPRREQAAQLLRRAAERGELPPDADMELNLDFLAAPVYWRLAVVRTPTGDDYLDRLTAKVLAALAA
ncbi:TetR-like C-terminal domain-containing protein [Streptomyces sp. NBC_00083]|uniref:TetR-like C-terminal domain-containing protein n=1 Tax=Streptomyces sp. NBC_00083 TaxID=2975647 RepID=UPI00225A0AD4|nr:TetR-like C-terminal domain-containing protein [Streptomyces sp. NBC_00083]MCX5383842.1 TetR/AcrR family transcriptional regulator C-terminal ligand-binding domain-containing protein [Streptomyces sp. NBC_00083]